MKFFLENLVFLDQISVHLLHVNFRFSFLHFKFQLRYQHQILFILNRILFFNELLLKTIYHRKDFNKNKISLTNYLQNLGK